MALTEPIRQQLSDLLAANRVVAQRRFLGSTLLTIRNR